MAQPPAPSRPMRTLLVMLIFTIGMAVWAAWPGTPNTPRLGLDLQGGTQVILTPSSVEEGQQITDEQLTQTVEIIRQRVNGIGVAEAEISIQGAGDSAAIIVAAPGVSQERLVELVGRTALLDFRPVYSIASPVPVGDDTSASADISVGDDTSAITLGNEIIQAPENTPEFAAEVAALNCLLPENIAGGTPDNPTEWLGD